MKWRKRYEQWNRIFVEIFLGKKEIVYHLQYFIAGFKDGSAVGGYRDSEVYD